MDKVFIDTNIPMYAAGSEHPNRQPSQKILEKISKQQIFGVTSTEVFQEILHRYQSINLMNSGIKIFEEFSSIVDEVLQINFKIMENAKIILSGNPGILTRDAIHAATIEYYNIDYIATFDKHFENFKNIRYYTDF
jgi:predicted nucleic acid-binding protein